MSASRFTGRVRLASGAAAYGCHVILTVGDLDTRVAEAWTSSKGEFVLQVPAGRVAAGEGAAAGFRIVVTDGTGAVLATRGDLVARSGSATHLELTSDARALVTLPIALPLLRAHHTPILRPEAMAVIDAALSLLAPIGSPTHDRYQAAARRSLPPPGHVEELLELSWGALDGDPSSIADLRDILAVQSATLRREAPVGTHAEQNEQRSSRHRAYGVPRDQAPRPTTVQPDTITGRLLTQRPQGTSSSTSRSRVETAVTTDRLMPLLVATVRISHSAAERVAFFDGLHAVLAGLSTVDRLHRAALDVLQERRIAPMRALLALLMAEGGDQTDLPLPIASGHRAAGLDPSLPDLVDAWWERHQLTVSLAIETVRSTRELAQPYVIESIAPLDAAPGDTVRIRGQGFGTSTGEVSFTGASAVAATSWSAQSIEVVVPEGCAPGPVSLRVLQGVVRVDKKLVELYRQGSDLDFEGGHPQLRSILVDGKGEGAWVRPGEAVAVSWTALCGLTGQVRLRAVLRPKGADDEDHARILLDDGELPASGSRIIAVPDVDQEHELLLQLRVENGVGVARRDVLFPVAVPPVLSIEGVEVTQGIQHDPRSLAAPVPTVALRDTFVRVYVSSDRDGFADDHTRIDHATLRIGDHLLPTCQTGGGTGNQDFVAGRPSAIDRSRPDHALVFRVPAFLCQGTRELQVEVSSAGRPPHAPHAIARVTWTWTSVRPLPIRYVRVRADDPHGATLMVSDDQARATMARAVDLIPTTPDDVGPSWSPVLDAAGDVSHPESPAHDRLLEQLAQQRDGTSWEWAASRLDDVPPSDPNEVWLGVLPAPSNGMVDPQRRVGLVPRWLAEGGPAEPSRTAGARVLAAALGEGTPAGSRSRLSETPWDPHLVTTVVDAEHGLHDLSPPPGVSWISPERWRRLLDHT